MNDRFEETCAGPAVLEVDRLLHDFYQAELPDPWPPLPVRLPLRGPVVRRYSLPLVRLAVAASVVLAFLAYWVLGGLFPQPSASWTPGTVPEIGEHQSPFKKRLSPIEHQRTPAGNDAQVFEEPTSNGQVITIIGPSASKGMR
jgi:hypothetical protein